MIQARAARRVSASPSASLSARSRPRSSPISMPTRFPSRSRPSRILWPLVTAALAGILTMVLFVLWPLGRASRVSPAVLMRAHLSDEGQRSIARLRARLACRRAPLCSPRHRGVRGAHHHGLHLRRHRRRFLPAARLRLRRAEACEPHAPHASKPPRWRSRSPASAAPARSRAPSRSRSVSASGSSSPSRLIQRSLIAEIQGNIIADAPAYYFLDIDAGDLAAFKDTMQNGRARRQGRRRADAARPYRCDQGRAGREDRAAPRTALGALRRPRPHLHRHRAGRVDHRRGRVVAEGLYRAAARLLRRRDRQGPWPQARRQGHRQHSRPQRRGEGGQLAQDRLGVARHQLRHGVLAEHAGSARHIAS